MAKAKISLTFEIPKTVRFNEDGTVSMIVKCGASGTTPKGLKPLGESIFNINIGPRQWKKVSADITENTKLFINGGIKGSVNPKGIPFITVNCLDIGIIKDRNTDTQSESATIPESLDSKKKEVKQKPEDKPKVPVKVKSNAEIKIETQALRRFRLSHEAKLLPLKEVILTSYVHLSSVKFQFNLGDLEWARKKIKPIIVRPIGEDKYTLVSGLNEFAAAKLLDIENIEAFITDLTYEELIEKWRPETTEEN